MPAFSPQLPTGLCVGGYVSGTIQRLKQGPNPHPQGSGPKGSGIADGFRLSVLFYLQRLEE